MTKDTKESPADKIKREAAEQADKTAKAKLKATEDTGSGDGAERTLGDPGESVEDQVTDQGKAVEATGPVATEVPEDLNEEPFTEDELNDLVGDLEPGELGWLPLDRLGRVIGPAKKGKPGADELGTPVQAVVQRMPMILQTPSGAPILKRMNPSYANAPKARYS